MYGRSSGSCSNVGSSSSSRRRRLCLSFYLNFCCSCPMATLLFWGYRPSSACGWQHQRQRDMNERTSTKIEKERKTKGGKTKRRSRKEASLHTSFCFSPSSLKKTGDQQSKFVGVFGHTTTKHRRAVAAAAAPSVPTQNLFLFNIVFYLVSIDRLIDWLIGRTNESKLILHLLLHRYCRQFFTSSSSSFA